jgi:hypothetical protein
LSVATAWAFDGRWYHSLCRIEQHPNHIGENRIAMKDRSFHDFIGDRKYRFVFSSFGSARLDFRK